MRKNYGLRYGLPITDKVGKVELRAVDQTPVSKQFKAPNGYYHSDLYMLRLASDKGDKSAFEALSNRLSGITPEPANGKTIKQLFDDWKPLYIQTPVEEQAWLQYVHDCQPELYDRLYGKEDKEFEDSQKTQSDETSQSE